MKFLGFMFKVIAGLVLALGSYQILAPMGTSGQPLAVVAFMCVPIGLLFAPWVVPGVLALFSGDNTKPSGHSQSSSGHKSIAPKPATSEVLFIPATDRLLTQDDVVALCACVNEKLQSSRSPKTSLFTVSSSDSLLSLGLTDSTEKLYIWAEFANEIQRVAVTLHYAEFNKGKWRDKRESNWQIEISKQEQLRRYSPGENPMGMVYLLASVPHAANLSDAVADEAQKLKQAFMASLSMGLEEWKKTSRLPGSSSSAINKTPTPPRNSNFDWERE